MGPACERVKQAPAGTGGGAHCGQPIDLAGQPA